MVVLTHYLLMIFFICSFCTSFHLPTRNDNSEECSGMCVKVTECKSLEQRFGKSMSKEKSDFLKSSWCGFDQGTPKICCPHKQSIEITSDLEKQNKGSHEKSTTFTTVSKRAWVLVICFICVLWGVGVVVGQIQYIKPYLPMHTVYELHWIIPLFGIHWFWGYKYNRYLVFINFY